MLETVCWNSAWEHFCPAYKIWVLPMAMATFTFSPGTVRMQTPPRASPGFLRMLEEAMQAEEKGVPFGGALSRKADPAS